MNLTGQWLQAVAHILLAPLLYRAYVNYFNYHHLILSMKKNKENNVDEEFDLFLQKFIDDVSHCNDDDSDDDDTPDTSAHDDSESPQLPFPREMDSRVAEIQDQDMP